MFLDNTAAVAGFRGNAHFTETLTAEGFGAVMFREGKMPGGNALVSITYTFRVG